MKTQYLFSSPNGDLSLGPGEFERPFLITPSEPHPFLTLGDYFDDIKTFILKDRAMPLISVLKDQIKIETSREQIREILIRSEKHGALYHLASVEIHVHNTSIKFSVSTAVSEKGKGWLIQEYEALNYLNRSLRLPYLPNVYFKGEVKRRTKKNRLTLAMFMGEWFAGYHEWHLSIDESSNSQKICIWDLEKGNRYASEEEAFEIFRQISKILTLYYEVHAFNQIYPWHHAAGDFIVSSKGNRMDVRLTTVRGYQPLICSDTENEMDPMIAIVYFFLNMTIRIRLDKLDGVGETAWAGDFSVDAATKGFFEALGIMHREGRYDLGEVPELLLVLQSFSEHELEKLFQPLLVLLQRNDPSDLSVTKANLRTHVTRLHQTLQNFRL